MNRAYDVFVDNGLFVLSYYLKKKVEDISYSDIEDSVEFMSDKVEEFLECKKFSNLKTMFLFNSAVSNPSLKNVKLKTVLKSFLEDKGTDYCMLCGENHANINMKLKGRSYLPNRPSGTYFNFSNNLHNINVCPYCVLLTVYSVMNCRVNQTVYLYNSPDDDFMKCYTIDMQDENLRDIKVNAEKNKNNTNRIDILLDIVYKNAVFDSDIEIYRFDNGKDEKILDSDILYSKNIKLIRNMASQALLSEFKSLGLSWMLSMDKLNYRYLDYVYDFENEELKCSRKLLDFLNTEVNMIDEKTISIIDRITDKIAKANLNDKKLRQNLRSVNNIRAFENELMRILELYNEKTDEGLFTTEEYNILTNIRNFVSVRNMILIDLINK